MSSYIQLVQPDFSTIGRIGYCLEYARKCFGAAAVEPNAWVAWGNTKFRLDEADLPKNVCYLNWYSYFENGENLGHVTITAPDGVHSSPWQQGTTHAVLPSIAEVERIYGVKYVGSSADISNVQVIKGDAMTRDELGLLHWLAMFKPPGKLWLDAYEGKSYEEAANSLRNDAPFSNPFRADTEAQYNAGAQVPDLESKVSDLTAANQKLVDQLTALKATPVVTDPSVTVTQSGLWAAFKRFLGL